MIIKVDPASSVPIFEQLVLEATGLGAAGFDQGLEHGAQLVSLAVRRVHRGDDSQGVGCHGDSILDLTFRPTSVAPATFAPFRRRVETSRTRIGASVRPPSANTVAAIQRGSPEAISPPKCASRKLAGTIPANVATANRHALRGVNPAA